MSSSSAQTQECCGNLTVDGNLFVRGGVTAGDGLFHLPIQGNSVVPLVLPITQQCGFITLPLGASPVAGFSWYSGTFNLPSTWGLKVVPGSGGGTGGADTGVAAICLASSIASGVSGSESVPDVGVGSQILYEPTSAQFQLRISSDLFVPIAGNKTFIITQFFIVLSPKT